MAKIDATYNELATIGQEHLVAHLTANGVTEYVYELNTDSFQVEHNANGVSLNLYVSSDGVNWVEFSSGVSVRQQPAKSFLPSRFLKIKATKSTDAAPTDIWLRSKKHRKPGNRIVAIHAKGFGEVASTGFWFHPTSDDFTIFNKSPTNSLIVFTYPPSHTGSGSFSAFIAAGGVWTSRQDSVSGANKHGPLHHAVVAYWSPLAPASHEISIIMRDS